MKHLTKAAVLSRALPLLAVMLAPAPMAFAQNSYVNGVNITDSDANSAALFVGPNNSASFDGAVCIGFACTDGHDFGGFDNGILQILNNNPSIEFEDTSTSGPTRDWTLLVNDVFEGERERFSIRDDTQGTIPFTVAGGAPNNALWVGQFGRIGLGTSLPRANLHIISPSISQIRLETTGSPNEAVLNINNDRGNFTLSAGPAIPLKIGRGSPSDSLVVASTGNVGLGTAMPEQKLHIATTADNTDAFALFDAAGSGSDAAFLLRQNGTIPTTWEFRNQQGSGRLNVGIAGGNTPLKIDNAAANNLLKLGTNSNASAVVVTGQLLVNNTQLNVPDYVFADDYALRPLADVRSFINTNSHLPEVPSALDIGRDGVDMTAMQMVLLKKVEELTLYTLEQDRLITAHQQTNVAQAETNAGLQDRLDRIEALLER